MNFDAYSSDIPALIAVALLKPIRDIVPLPLQKGHLYALELFLPSVFKSGTQIGIVLCPFEQRVLLGSSNIISIHSGHNLMRLLRLKASSPSLCGNIILTLESPEKKAL